MARHGRWLFVPLALLLLAAPAQAAQRFASPTPSGTMDCSSAANACSIVTAINSAPNADGEVILAGGAYDVGAVALHPPTFRNFSIHTADGAGSLATITTNAANGLQLDGNAESIRDVVIQHTGVSDALALNQATGERMIVHSTAGTSCRIGGTISPALPGTLLDSVCWTDAVGGNAIKVANAGPSSATLRNVTAWAANTAPPGGIGLGLQEAGSPPDAMNVTATNAILFGAGKDVRLSSGPGMTAHLDVDHSNYDPAFAQLQGAGSSISGSANQTAAPSLVDAPPHGIDFRQFQDSPTIDAGVTDPLNGTKDFTGDLRTLGSSTDIGADEWNPATAQTGGAIAITQTSASVGGVVTPNGNATSSYVEYGTTTAYGSQTSPKPLGSGNAPVSTGADLTGLSPGTTYHYRLVATNALGTIPGGDSTFTTVAAPGESSGGSTTATTAGTTTPSTPSILPPTSVLPITPPTKTTTKKPSCAKSRLATSAKKKKKRKPTCKKPKRKKTKKKK